MLRSLTLSETLHSNWIFQLNNSSLNFHFSEYQKKKLNKKYLPITVFIDYSQRKLTSFV